jgi:hypothetical protein
VDRGQAVDIGNACASDASAATPPPTAGAVASIRGVVGRSGLKYSVRLQRRKLRTALRRGLRGVATCSRRCTMNVTLKRGKTAVGRVKLSRTFNGRRSFTLRFTKKAVRRLRRSRSASFTVAVSARDTLSGLQHASRGRLRLRR